MKAKSPYLITGLNFLFFFFVFGVVYCLGYWFSIGLVCVKGALSVHVERMCRVLK